MFAGGILRVGIFTLILTTTLLAEAIPFDYWYGRMVGGQHITIDYSDSKNGLSKYALSFSGGRKNIFEIGVPNMVIWTPNSKYRETEWTNPTINGALQISSSTRYLLEKLDIVNEDEGENRPGYFRDYDRGALTWNQSIVHLDKACIEYKPETSLFLYLKGIWLDPKQTFTRVDANLNIDESVYESISSPHVNDSLFNWQDSRVVSTEAQVEVQCGLSRVINFGVTASVQHSSDRQRTSRRDTERNSEPDEPGIYNYFYYRNRPKTDIVLSSELIWMPKRTLWFEFGITGGLHGYSWEDTGGDGNLAVGDALDITTRVEEQCIKELKIDLATTWLSKDQLIEYGRILDNFQDYYGVQLEPGTIMINSEVEYSDASRSVDRWTNPHGGSIYYYGPESNRHFKTAASVDLHLSRSFRFGTSGSFANRSRSLRNVNGHDQSLALSFDLSYMNRKWSAGDLNDVAWSGTSDIDYLLGALLRPGDLRWNASITPPIARGGGVSANRGFLTLYKLRFADDWQVSSSFAIGIREQVELGVNLGYVNQYSLLYQGQDSRWFITPKVRWQPISWLRLSSQLSNHIYHPVDLDTGIILDERSRSWTLAISMDCVF